MRAAELTCQYFGHGATREVPVDDPILCRFGSVLIVCNRCDRVLDQVLDAEEANRFLELQGDGAGDVHAATVAESPTVVPMDLEQVTALHERIRFGKPPRGKS